MRDGKLKKRILTLLLAVSMIAGNVLSVAGSNVHAEEINRAEETDQIEYVTESQVNPLYRDVLREEELYQSSESDISLYEAPQYESDEATVVATLRQSMLDRKTEVTLYYASVDGYDSKRMGQWIEQAFEENDMPDGGDYLRWTYGGYKADISYFYDASEKLNYYTYYISFTYYTTYEQEQELKMQIAAILQELEVLNPENDDYTKVKLIYDYICEHVSYDYEHLNDPDYKLQYTAYAAMIQHTSVCQGYATLLYRMLETVGIDSRIITGTGNGGPHAWNIVQLGDKYYLMDATWDSGNKNNQYFLKGTSDFIGHVASSEFLSDYPVAFESYSRSTDVHVHSLILNISQIQLENEKQERLTVSCKSGDAISGDEIIWSSSDEDVVSVATDGTVTAHNAGQAYVMAKVGKSTVACTVSVVGWKQDSIGFQYIKADGIYCKAGWNAIEGKWYYFDTNGYRLSNRWIGSYFLKEDGTMAVSEWIDNTYYVNADGIYQTGWLKLDGKWYYLNNSGAKQTGWIQVDGTWYYGQPETGALLEQDWLNDRYYFYAGGAMATGWVQIDGIYYYCNLDGVKITSAWVGSYYVKADGTMAVSEWVDNTYYVNADGIYQTGWLKLDGKWYYLNNSGAKQTGWISVSGTWYYGEPATGALLEKEWLNDTYYFYAGGAMATGWVQIDGTYYYCNAGGAKVKNAWVGNYYLKADGVMATDEWVDNDRYYVDANGVWVPNKVR